MEKNKRREGEPVEVLSVIKTLRILEALAENEKIGLTDLARIVEGHKSTVYRFMCTLIDQGYATRDENEFFSATLKMFQVGMCVFSRIDIAQVAAPILKRIAFLSEETVHLVMDDDGQLVYLNKIESTHNLRVSMQSKIGGSAPKYCTGVGKILLAWMDRDALDKYLASCAFVRFTDKTIVNRLDLENELSRIRELGYCFDDEEHEYGVRCVAAPVRNHEGKVVASVSVSGPVIRLDDDRMKVLSNLVVESANEISSKIGWNGSVL